MPNMALVPPSLAGPGRAVYRDCDGKETDSRAALLALGVTVLAMRGQLQRRRPERWRAMHDDRAVHQRVLHMLDRPAVRGRTAMRRGRLRLHVSVTRRG